MKTFEDFSKDNLDIDPYGEENWDEIGVNWDEIKIVRPTINDIGKKVMISPGSRYYCEGDGTNPKNTIGTITYFDKRLGMLPFDVIWSNSQRNSYRDYDLTLIDDTVNEGYVDHLNISQQNCL